jgi:nucleoside triphosphate pyrophosphatase
MVAPRVILASSSPRRRELLSLIGIAHEVRPADIDERVLPGETPEAHCERLAREKATALASGVGEGTLVIGGDTIVVVDDRILGKPRDEADAAGMLRVLSGRTHEVLTAVAVMREGRVEAGVERVAVTFRTLDEPEIAAYIATREPMDKAGAYGIQGYGATIVERIEGDYFAVMGLAINRLIRMMALVGVRYEFGRLIAVPSA